jgi:hypothetical protein
MVMRNRVFFPIMLLLNALCWLPALLLPGNAQYVAPGNMPGGNVLGYCFVSQSTNAAIGTTAVCACPTGVTCQGSTGIPNNAKWAWVESEGAAMRCRADGTAPTASVGFALPGGSATSPAYIALSASLPLMQCIPQSGTETFVIEWRN